MRLIALYQKLSISVQTVVILAHLRDMIQGDSGEKINGV